MKIIVFNHLKLCSYVVKKLLPLNCIMVNFTPIYFLFLYSFKNNFKNENII